MCFWEFMARVYMLVSNFMRIKQSGRDIWKKCADIWCQMEVRGKDYCYKHLKEYQWEVLERRNYIYKLWTHHEIENWKQKEKLKEERTGRESDFKRYRRELIRKLSPWTDFSHLLE